MPCIRPHVHHSAILPTRAITQDGFSQGMFSLKYSSYMLDMRSIFLGLLTFAVLAIQTTAGPITPRQDLTVAEIEQSEEAVEEEAEEQEEQDIAQLEETELLAEWLDHIIGRRAGGTAAA
jgi:hypothetical protein